MDQISTKITSKNSIVRVKLSQPGKVFARSARKKNGVKVVNLIEARWRVHFTTVLRETAASTSPAVSLEEHKDTYQPRTTL